MAQKLRSEMDTAFTWDFTDIFASDEAWETAYGEAKQAIERIAAVPGTLGESAEAMQRGLETIYDAAKQMELVYVYAMLRKNVDNGDSKYQAMQGRAMNLNVEFSAACAFLEPEILPLITKSWQGLWNPLCFKPTVTRFIISTVYGRIRWMKKAK